jgi:hypothetical protein
MGGWGEGSCKRGAAGPSPSGSTRTRPSFYLSACLPACLPSCLPVSQPACLLTYLSSGIDPIRHISERPHPSPEACKAFGRSPGCVRRVPESLAPHAFLAFRRGRICRPSDTRRPRPAFGHFGQAFAPAPRVAHQPYTDSHTRPPHSPTGTAGAGAAGRAIAGPPARGPTGTPPPAPAPPRRPRRRRRRRTRPPAACPCGPRWAGGRRRRRGPRRRRRTRRRCAGGRAAGPRARRRPSASAWVEAGDVRGGSVRGGSVRGGSVMGGNVRVGSVRGGSVRGRGEA